MVDGVRCVRMVIDALRRGNYSSESINCNYSAVEGYIDGYYKAALDRLPRSLLSLVDEAGFCFGFLDPVSNIIANTAAYEGAASSQAEGQGGRGKKRKRSQAGSSIAARSLEGLVDFLMRHAVSRFQRPHSKNVLPVHDLEVARMQVLLARIHAFYLEAISRIPAPCLRSRHHRGLLKAGHCYGPFDPVTNIILNTIWYDTAFPPQQEFKVDMICDESLALTECRSLHGLITFATTLFPALSTYDATQYLLFDNARLDSVVSRAKLEGYQSSIPLSNAYEAAAHMAKHPYPAALANLATGLFLEIGEVLKSFLKVKHSLSSDDVHIISTAFSQNDPPSKPVRLDQKLSSRACRIVSSKRKNFESHQSSIRKRVQAALKNHAQLKASSFYFLLFLCCPFILGEDYELLVICGVNGQIPNEGKFGYFDNYDGYPYSHINIWARLKGPQLADAAPTLLFIECSNDPKDTKDINFLCLPVSKSTKDAGRCFHCECGGSKIVHPLSLQTYLGQTFDFEKMAHGKHTETNEGLVRIGALRNVFVDTSEDSCIYFDPAWDADLAERLNRDAKREKGKKKGFVQAQSLMVKEMLREMVTFIDKEKEMVSSIK
ncbi:hypothetical protein EJB05_21915, partial [Eragrostis curvula]